MYLIRGTSPRLVGGVLFCCIHCTTFLRNPKLIFGPGNLGKGCGPVLGCVSSSAGVFKSIC